MHQDDTSSSLHEAHKSTCVLSGSEPVEEFTGPADVIRPADQANDLSRCIVNKTRQEIGVSKGRGY